MNLVIRSQLFASALSRTLFPRMSRLDEMESRRLSERSLVTLAFGYAAICAPAIVMAKPFLSLWIGPAFGEVGGSVAELLLLGAWINGLALMPYNLLQAQGRPDVVAKFHMAEAIPYVGLLFLLTTYFGLIGAALAWTLRVALDAALLCWAAKFDRTAILRILPAAMSLVVMFVIVKVHTFQLVPAFGLAAVVGIAVVGLTLLFDAQARTFLPFRRSTAKDVG